MYRKDFAPSQFFSGRVVDLTQPLNSKTQVAEANAQGVAADSSAAASSAPAVVPAPEERSRAEFVSADPKSHIVSPDQDPRVRINPEAPGPFKAMALAFQDGDHALAAQYADQFVRYQINLMYEVKELTSLIGEALIRQSAVEEEDWVGVEQYLDREFAYSRADNSSPIRATHEEGLKRIVADPAGQAEIYFFLNLNSKWARQMAPDIERLWRLVQHDSKLKMGVFGLGPAPKNFLASYKDYTGLTAPILDGAEVAKSFRVAFVPAVVVVAPGSKSAYVRTGLQSFKELYELIAAVQGRPMVMTQAATKLMNTPIGYVELAQLKGDSTISIPASSVEFRGVSAKPAAPDKMERF